MKRVLRLLRANPAEIRVFATSIAVMGMMRVALAAAPLQRVILWMNEDHARRRGKKPVGLDVQRAALRIVQASAYCPLPTTCLSRTLAAHLMMSRLGFTSVPRIGVRNANGHFAAHAWLECQDGIVIGDASPDGETYTPVQSLERFFA